ncbi:restriction endonuclease [Candidatus Sumerlaeota bacterium]|nr:restriction endonuclease [Candidatus Sumerlaeota bacterium]
MQIDAQMLNLKIRDAVAHFWKTRRRQANMQKTSGRRDQGNRGSVTGGAQMDGFIELISDLIVQAGVDRACIFNEKALELPGYFRPEKKWDLLVVQNERFILGLEAKSQVGPSFGNNFNNRTEEAMGSAMDLWTAFREGAFKNTVRPWLGYIFLLEDCEASRVGVRLRQPHFRAFPEFIGASYARRYEIFCRKLMRERHYDATAFMTAQTETGRQGEYEEPAQDLSFLNFVRSMLAHVSAHAALKSKS